MLSHLALDKIVTCDFNKLDVLSSLASRVNYHLVIWCTKLDTSIRNNGPAVSAVHGFWVKLVVDYAIFGPSQARHGPITSDPIGGYWPEGDRLSSEALEAKIRHVGGKKSGMLEEKQLIRRGVWRLWPPRLPCLHRQCQAVLC
jgi:hypothetical protein